MAKRLIVPLLVWVLSTSFASSVHAVTTVPCGSTVGAILEFPGSDKAYDNTDPARAYAKAKQKCRQDAWRMMLRDINNNHDLPSGYQCGICQDDQVPSIPGWFDRCGGDVSTVSATTVSATDQASACQLFPGQVSYYRCDVACKVSFKVQLQCAACINLEGGCTADATGGEKPTSSEVGGHE